MWGLLADTAAAISPVCPRRDLDPRSEAEKKPGMLMTISRTGLGVLVSRIHSPPRPAQQADAAARGWLGWADGRTRRLGRVRPVWRRPTGIRRLCHWDIAHVPLLHGDTPIQDPSHGTWSQCLVFVSGLGTFTVRQKVITNLKIHVPSSEPKIIAVVDTISTVEYLHIYRERPKQRNPYLLLTVCTNRNRLLTQH